MAARGSHLPLNAHSSPIEWSADKANARSVTPGAPPQGTTEAAKRLRPGQSGNLRRSVTRGPGSIGPSVVDDAALRLGPSSHTHLCTGKMAVPTPRHATAESAEIQPVRIAVARDRAAMTDRPEDETAGTGTERRPLPPQRESPVCGYHLSLQVHDTGLAKPQSILDQRGSRLPSILSLQAAATP